MTIPGEVIGLNGDSATEPPIARWFMPRASGEAESIKYSQSGDLVQKLFVRILHCLGTILEIYGVNRGVETFAGMVVGLATAITPTRKLRCFCVKMRGTFSRLGVIEDGYSIFAACSFINTLKKWTGFLRHYVPEGHLFRCSQLCGCWRL